MALLQPAPEVYELFDDILLMAEGHVIFHGPKEDVLPFFESLGFKLPARKGIGDFLQEVASPEQPEQAGWMAILNWPLADFGGSWLKCWQNTFLFVT